ncbi:Uncharacterised protein [Vibrio cholerae]|nr:Uncharacterised protein [Vibrio cholerae]
MHWRKIFRKQEFTRRSALQLGGHLFFGLRLTELKTTGGDIHGCITKAAVMVINRRDQVIDSL